MSKHCGDFYFLNSFHSFKTKNKLESHKTVSKNKDFCDIIMPFENTKILESNQYQNSDKVSFVIYADLECFIKKIDGCKNNPEDSSTIKVTKHVSSGFLMYTISSFRSIENKHDVYRGKDSMKKICESLGEPTMKTINFKKTKRKLLTKE